MPRYTPPARDMQFVLHELLDVGNALSEMPDFAEVDAEIVDQVLDGELPIDAYVTHRLSGVENTLGAVDALHGGDCLRAVVSY